MSAISRSVRDIAAIDRRELARRLAYLPQDRVVHWPLRVEALVALGRLPHRAPAAAASPKDEEAVAQALIAMDLVHVADRPVDQLSGGERARVLVGRALAQEAAVILADEPTAGLDPAHALAFFAVLERLAADGRTIAVALHDLSLAARFCHDVVIMGGGRLLAAGPTREVMDGERLGSAFGVHFRLGQFDNVPIVVPMGALR